MPEVVAIGSAAEAVEGAVEVVAVEVVALDVVAVEVAVEVVAVEVVAVEVVAVEVVAVVAGGNDGAAAGAPTWGHPLVAARCLCGTLVELVRSHSGRIMPFLRALSTTIVLATGGCSFDADYSGTGITCSDGRCPAGTVCRADATCGPPIDAPPDDAIDARMPALTCADPGALPATGGSAMGTTTGRSPTVSAMCGGFVMNGRDAVYELELPAARTIHVDIAGGRKAYAIAPCTVAPATPACIGNAFAASGVPLTITPTAGATFIVVDDENPANASGYTLTVTVD